MTRLLAVDPGGACLGWAYFEGGLLRGCGLSRTKAKTVDERAAHHRRELACFFPDRVVCERMTWRGRRSKATPQDLMDLNVIAGALGREWVTPAQWKGHAPKEIHQPRILKALDARERELVSCVKPPSLRHNAIDAVGIGLFALGRLRP